MSNATSTNEKVQPPKSLQALLSLEGEAFICGAYLAFLGRAPDMEGFNHYMEFLDQDHDKLGILSSISNSAEARHTKFASPKMRVQLARAIKLRRPLFAWLHFPTLFLIEHRNRTSKLADAIEAIDKAKTAIDRLCEVVAQLVSAPPPNATALTPQISNCCHEGPASKELFVLPQPEEGQSPLGNPVTPHSSILNIDTDGTLQSEQVTNARFDRLLSEVVTIETSGQFDRDYYVSMYPELHLAPSDAVRHFCEIGWREGRDPSDDFSTTHYLETYQDIKQAQLNPFWHYITSGKSEGRESTPALNQRFEADANFGQIVSDVLIIAFYETAEPGKIGSSRPRFKGHIQPFSPLLDEITRKSEHFDALREQGDLARRHGVGAFCFPIDTLSSLLTARLIDSIHSQNIPIPHFFQVRLPTTVQQADNIADTVQISISRDDYLHVRGRPVLIINGETSPEHISGEYLSTAIFSRHGVRPYLILRPPSTQGTAIVNAPDYVDAVLDLPEFALASESGGFKPIRRASASVVPYKAVANAGVRRASDRSIGPARLFNTIILGRDESTSHSSEPIIYSRFSIFDFRSWLNVALSRTRELHPLDERFVFLHSWNGWKNGLYLEPDKREGFARLNEISRALLQIAPLKVQPKVTVIVPNYNHAAFLRQRLASIYHQTYKNVEVILMDDCSTDGSLAILEEYATAFPHITRLLKNSKNSGSPFSQWAKGISAATGDLIWIAESDDFCEHTFLEQLLPSFDDQSVLLAYGKSVFTDRAGRPFPHDEFRVYLSDLDEPERWDAPYVESAHNEVRKALGIKNTIPNASSVLFRRPIDLALLRDASWLRMRVAGDWVFYLWVIRSGRLAYNPSAKSYFRRYDGSSAHRTYREAQFYKEVSEACRTVASLYNVPVSILERCRDGYRKFFHAMIGDDTRTFDAWFNFASILDSTAKRTPNILVSSMGFYPGGAEILPIRLANEFKRKGHSVLFFNTGLNSYSDGVRRMLRADIPVIESSTPEGFRETLSQFGIEAHNSHQWHVQKYPTVLPNVFYGLRAHVASLHGMIEHGEAFAATEAQLLIADENVSTWVYTAKKNLKPFAAVGIYDHTSEKFVHIPNGMPDPTPSPLSRAALSIPDDAFVFCCVSRAIPDKGWAEMIEVVRLARELSGVDIHIILVGNGPVYDDYCAEGTAPYVHLTGFSEDSVGHYAISDMGIMLTKFKSESFPLTIVDCLFAGRPFIASDIGEIRQILTVDQETCGAVIPLSDWEIPVEYAAQVVASFASDAKLYASAICRVERAAERYRIDAVAEKYLDLLKSGTGLPSERR